MRDFRMRVWCTVIARVPDDSPALELSREIARYGAQEPLWCDGRYPYNAELLHDGALGIIRYALDRALFQHYTAEMRPSTSIELSQRNARVARDFTPIVEQMHLRDPGRVQVDLDPAEEALELLESRHVESLRKIAARLYSEQRMTGDEMRDAAHTLSNIVQYLEDLTA